jgi:hypothetical protein
MIIKLSPKNKIDVYEAVTRIRDTFEEFYITHDKERKYLKDFRLIEKLLKQQEIFALQQKEIKGLLLIYKQAGFRRYAKILAEDNNSSKALIKFLLWNYSDTDMYIKLKKTNPLVRHLLHINPFTKTSMFKFAGDRGKEILLYRKKEIKINRIGAKDGL